jgi:hypothetical protein
MGARREYQTLSPEGQREFDRWLKANAILGALFGIGMLTMALAGGLPGFFGPRLA